MSDSTLYDIVELGDPRLRVLALPVDLTRLQEALEVVQAMESRMQERGGVGIAAPQIGVGQQIMIIASKPNARYPDAPHMKPMVMFNPVPFNYSDHKVTLWEGCLSVPGIRGKVTRSDSVSVRYADNTGKLQEIRLDGFPARIFLHEYDHLVGKTFVDRVDSVTDLVTDKVYFKQMSTSVS
ncbi:peptide deformylase [Ketobacter sp. MCCC 1A13808]|uniref:peptide deformylase n=1 Tax=Ketobacter sp. MCCC 1A13808 TaxID=2602738 RepID=UPI000F0E1E0F|nr:peptide deformylase [Ketobacter sp. MCCC 1A13808]MVF14642.1 peptide deformylase [Ketobacter sp. MCCC 1A13808]RLP52421.1 MAG: peptide deformylase [Ketobacter sp.]